MLDLISGSFSLGKSQYAEFSSVTFDKSLLENVKEVKSFLKDNLLDKYFKLVTVDNKLKIMDLKELNELIPLRVTINYIDKEFIFYCLIKDEDYPIRPLVVYNKVVASLLGKDVGLEIIKNTNGKSYIYNRILCDRFFVEFYRIGSFEVKSFNFSNINARVLIIQSFFRQFMNDLQDKKNVFLATTKVVLDSNLEEVPTNTYERKRLFSRKSIGTSSVEDYKDLNDYFSPLNKNKYYVSDNKMNIFIRASSKENAEFRIKSLKDANFIPDNLEEYNIQSYNSKISIMLDGKEVLDLYSNRNFGKTVVHCYNKEA